MRRLLFAITGICVATMFTPSAFADDHGDWYAKGGGERYSTSADAPSGDHWKKYYRDEDRRSKHHGHHHDELRWSKTESHWRPPGWDKGNKKGWGDGDMPPGLSRKADTQDWSRRQQSTSDTLLGPASDAVIGIMDRIRR